MFSRPACNGLPFCLTFKNFILKRVRSFSLTLKCSNKSMQEKEMKTRKMKCTFLSGNDDVCQQLCQSVKDVFKAIQVPVLFEEYKLAEEHEVTEDIFLEAVQSVKNNRVALKCSSYHPRVTDEMKVQRLNLRMSRSLDLYATVAHVRKFPGVETRHENIDVAIIYDISEGESGGLEHQTVPGSVQHLKICTKEKSEKIAKFAFNYALRRGRKRVTVVHNAKEVVMADGLFLKSCLEIAKLYPDIECDSIVIQHACKEMVTHAGQFDALVMPFLYGHILSSIAVGMVGGAGLVPSSSYSSDYVVYEPTARPTFEIPSDNNPTAFLFCGVGMLNHVGLHDYAERISSAVKKVLKEGKVKTKDLGGNATTADFTQLVIEHLLKS